MRKTVDMILRKYGTEVTLRRNAGNVTVRCFFQPVSSTSWQSIAHTASPLGYTTQAEYLCIAPAKAGIRDGEILVHQQREYLARRVESYCCGGQDVYQWVLCVEKGGEDTWGV